MTDPRTNLINAGAGKKTAPAKDAKAAVKSTKGTDTPEEVKKEVLPKGIDRDLAEKVRAVIKSGFAAEQAPDVIKSEIFKLGVPFSKLNTLFNTVARTENLVADPREVKFNVSNALKNIDLTYEEDYAALQALAANVAAEVTGATVVKVMAILKTDFKENEVDFPAKPKGVSAGTRMGAITKALIGQMKKNPKSTYNDIKAAVLPHVKGEENAVYYANQYHKLLYAVANSLSADEVLAIVFKEEVSG